jgi:DNA-binding NtrC family response regulator
LGLDWHVQSRAAAWLLELINEDFVVAVLDCEGVDPDNLSWIQLARRLRPKVPLIVIHEPQVDSAIVARFCEEKVFYFCPRPVDRGMLRQVFEAALRSTYEQEKGFGY